MGERMISRDARLVEGTAKNFICWSECTRCDKEDVHE